MATTIATSAQCPSASVPQSGSTNGSTKWRRSMGTCWYSVLLHLLASDADQRAQVENCEPTAAATATAATLAVAASLTSVLSAGRSMLSSLFAT